MAKSDKKSKRGEEDGDSVAEMQVELKAARKTIKQLELDAGSSRGAALELAKIKVIIDYHLEDFDIDLEAEMPFVVGLSLDENDEVVGEASYRPAAPKADAGEDDDGEDDDDGEEDTGDAADEAEAIVAAEFEAKPARKSAKQSRRVKAKPARDVTADAKAFFDKRKGVGM